MRDRILSAPGLLWVIIAVALALRLLGAWNGSMMYDETTHLACAETIDLHPQHLNLVPRSVDHPPMSVYLVRISEYLFGNSNFGIRILHALVGALTLLPVYLLAARIFSPAAGLWAAVLLATDQFHQSWSYFIVPEVLLLFFSALTLLQFMAATESRAGRDYALAGLYLGLAYLGKETALFLAPALGLSVLSVYRLRLFSDYRPWLTFLVALLVASPDIVNNIVHLYEGYFYRDADLMHSGWHPSLRVAVLYLGEFIQHYTGPRGGFPGTGLQNPTIIYWPAGILYLTAFVFALRQLSNQRIRLMLFTFAFIVLAFTALPSHGTHGTYWWASISVLPAVVLAGGLVATLQQSILRSTNPSVRTGGMLAGIALSAWFCLHAIQIGVRHGQNVQRVNATERTQLALQHAAEARSRGELPERETVLLHTLHIVGPNAGLYGYLADIALDRNDTKRAAYFMHRSLALDPRNPEAQRVRQQLENRAGVQ